MGNPHASPGDGTLRQRPDGRWEYRAIVGTDENGNAIRKSFYSKDKSGAGAKSKFRKWIAEREEAGPKISRTVKQWAEIWLETYKKGKVAPRSYRNYKLYVEQHILPSIGAYKLEDVRPVDIQRIYTKEDGLSASALNHIRIALNGIFNSAIDNKLCRENPAENIVPPKRIHKMPSAFTEEEIARILCFASTHKNGYYVEALLYTGLRIGELCALMWSDVDLERGIITVSKTLAITEEVGTKYAVKETTKTGKTRAVVLTQNGISVFRSIPRKGLFVFPGQRTPFCTPDIFRRRYDSVFHDMNTAAAPDERVRELSPHKCRHTYASFLLAGGANIRAVQDQLGHAKITTTEIYTHVDLKSREENVKKLGY